MNEPERVNVVITAISDLSKARDNFIEVESHVQAVIKRLDEAIRGLEALKSPQLDMFSS
jgi:hypothetical protein